MLMKVRLAVYEVGKKEKAAFVHINHNITFIFKFEYIFKYDNISYLYFFFILDALSILPYAIIYFLNFTEMQH